MPTIRIETTTTTNQPTSEDFVSMSAWMAVIGRMLSVAEDNGFEAERGEGHCPNEGVTIDQFTFEFETSEDLEGFLHEVDSFDQQERTEQDYKNIFYEFEIERE